MGMSWNLRGQGNTMQTIIEDVLVYGGTGGLPTDLLAENH